MFLYQNQKSQQCAKSNRPLIIKEYTLEFDGSIIESKLKEKNCTAKQREVLRRPKSTWDISQIGTLPKMIKADLGLSNGSINEDVQIFLTCTSLTYNEFLNIYKIIVIDNKKIPTIKLLQEAYCIIDFYKYLAAKVVRYFLFN